MKQTIKNKTTKQKIALLITIISITTSCSTNMHHKKIALKIIKNNNVILKEIQKERRQKIITSNIKGSPKLLTAERRLMTAINTVIKSNDSLKKEFSKKNKKEIENEREARSDYR